MLLPYLSEVQNPSKKYSVIFRGLNYGEGTQDGEFAETLNLSTDQYPCITQSKKRVRVSTHTTNSPVSIHAKGKMLIVLDENVYYDGKKVNKDPLPKRGKKQIATVGNYIIIFPDKVYYKVPTENDQDGEFGKMEITYNKAGLKFTSSTITVENGDDFPFEKGDSVIISGCQTTSNNKELIIRAVSENVLTFDDNAFTECTETGPVTITREVPDLDFICESNYRLWGTKGNTIYASKFSKPINFKSFDGLADDSYAIEVGSEGEFTGCIPYSSHICFFKENTLHKLYGSKPSNFQITTSNVYGVQSGSERSMQIINEQLLYKGVGGVYVYTGGVPELISGNFGNRRYSDAVACSDGEKYYISMRQGNTYHFFTYDIMRNIWLREDNLQAQDMAFYDGKVYFVNGSDDLYYIDKTEVSDNTRWEATFCTFHETMNERKGYSKFHLRMDLSAGAWLAVDIKTDNDLQWREVYTTHNEKAKTISIPIMPTRCDSIDIRLRGKGKSTIKAFIREFTVGSDI